ncbi:hypothetical protein AURDEDRAFT_111252 [Auricularia subglabra TFB-10046 SS5]|nr:hypothetical protein AURDEDRAFT_111252 [Auricularia subglabra TFB-10046 SS5]
MPSSVAAADEPRRIVPGAPPPPPLSKSQQKKKRKAGKPKEDGPAPDAILDLPKAPLIETAPSVADIANGAIEPALVSEPVPTPPAAAAAAGEPKKPSPSIEAVAKRLRALGKKVQRISTYAHLPTDQLNEDQRRTAATLPALELAVKELEEVKKNIETIEADYAKEEANVRAQEEEVVKQRVADAVADAQAASVSTASRILAFIRFSHLISSEPSITTAGLTDTERNAVYVAAQFLLGELSEQRDAVVSGFFSGTGDIEGVEYARLRQILDDHLAMPKEPVEPPRSPTPVAAEPEPEAAPEESAHGIPASASGASSFHFMQASELEGTPFEQGAEWIEKPEDEAAPEPAHPEYTHEEPEASASAEPTGPIDWANDDGGLPEIESLQAKFASSGEATPNLAPEAAAADGWTPAEPAAAEAYTPPTANGQATGPVVDDDGFTEARRPRTTSTRGGGDRGFRGRGGFRGGERGGYRGGRPDGEFRGRGGFRGGDRGRGEFRGRGRGGERGFRGGRGAAPVEA